MAIKTGRYGQVMYDSTGASTFEEVISLNHWTLDQAVDYEEVSCFGDTNKVFVPGLKDSSGTLEGFWNSAELTIWEATDAATPGKLKLIPNRTEASFFWSGLAYINASIDVDLAVPKVSGEWKAAGPWTTPGQIIATGASAGIPGAFTPAGATPPYALANMTGIVASPATAWTTGQHVEMGNGSDCYWNGTAWTAGIKS